MQYEKISYQYRLLQAEARVLSARLWYMFFVCFPDIRVDLPARRLTEQLVLEIAELEERIPEIEHLVVGRSITRHSLKGYALAYLCKFASVENLTTYKNHPAYLSLLKRWTGRVVEPSERAETWFKVSTLTAN